ncbi:polysaccharide biosynthesis protein [Methylorubrum populi]|uniref:Polysaccharide biosynthesis protein n=1 Tax=Methylorubrum populi TaxID=223967 RepID=A0A160PHC9_9HYPH|nr:oligosaccharide flippase family protein [Methylorubrum populi]BAU92789.1 polysaccharide biosynthesis protein [Methylorubrum populi]
MSKPAPATAAPGAPRPDDGATAHRFGVNVASNMAYFVLSTGLMLWYVPFLVRHLGVAAYGMVPLANSVVMYAIVVSESLYTAYFRYLAIDLNRGDGEAARQTFASASLLTLLACGLLLLPFGAFTLVLPHALAVPPDLDRATQFLFAGTACTLLAGLLTGLFSTSSAIAHRFDLRNLGRGASVAARVGVVAACFALWPASLWHVGAGLMASAAIGLAIDVAVWRRLTPTLRFAPWAADRACVRRLFRMTGWSSINMLGLLMLMHADLLVINLMFGPEATGRYGAILLIPLLVHTVAEIVLPLLAPLIMSRYAARDTEGIRDLVTDAARLLALGLALPAGLICGLGRPLLTLWLGPDFSGMHVVLALLVGHLTINLALRPVGYIFTAYDKMRLQGLVTVACGAAYVVMAVAAAYWGGWGLEGVAGACALVWTLRNTAVLSTCAARVLGLSPWVFIRPLAGGALMLVGLSLAGLLVAATWPPKTWPALAMTAAVLSLGYAGLSWAFLLSAADRTRAYTLVRWLLDGCPWPGRSNAAPDLQAPGLVVPAPGLARVRRASPTGWPRSRP